MFDLAFILHFASIALIIILCTLGGGIGGGLTGEAVIEAINIQPRAQGQILKTSIIGLALIETASILALIITFLLFKEKSLENFTLTNGVAKIGIALSIGITSLFVGIVSALPVRKSCLAIARQPFFSQKILNLMIITLSIIQTPVIFGFLIALFINFQISSSSIFYESIRFLAAGIAISIGSIGPVLGLAKFAEKACYSLSINRNSYDVIIPFVFMSAAIIETPLIFAFLVSLIITLTPLSNENPLAAIRMISAALCIGLGTLAPSLSSSKTATAACQEIAYKPQHYSLLSQASMFGQGLIDAAAVYALLIALMIIFIP
jgi:F-type H+-transporting ATPase subunit c